MSLHIFVKFFWYMLICESAKLWTFMSNIKLNKTQAKTVKMDISIFNILSKFIQLYYLNVSYK